MKPFKFHTRYVTEDHAVLHRAGQYANGSVALQVRAANGAPLATATVNLSNYGQTPEPGNVFIYGNYSEHWGVYEALRKAGIVSGPVRRLDYGRGNAHAFEAKLLVEV